MIILYFTNFINEFILIIIQAIEFSRLFTFQSFVNLNFILTILYYI